MRKLDLNEVLEGLKQTMDKQLKETEEMFNRIEQLQKDIAEQEEQIFLLESMKIQLQATVNKNYEELKKLKEARDKIRKNKHMLTKSELIQMKYDKEQQNLRLAVKHDKTEDDYKTMEKLDKEIKEIIKILEEC